MDKGTTLFVHPHVTNFRDGSQKRSLHYIQEKLSVDKGMSIFVYLTKMFYKAMK